MASIAGSTPSKDREFEELRPSFVWVEDPNCHYLHVDLPGFKEEEIKFQTDSTDHVTVSGERLVKGNKYIYFKETFKVPDNSDIQKTSRIFEDKILKVTVPKRAVVKPPVSGVPPVSVVPPVGEKPPDREVPPVGEEPPVSEEPLVGEELPSTDVPPVGEVGGGRYCIILVALAFSLGVWVSSKFNLGRRKKALE